MPATRLLSTGACLVALIALGCTSPSLAPSERSISANALKPRVLTLQVGQLTGQVTAPGVIAAGAGNVIAAGAGNIIASGGGNVIASGSLNYRALAAEDGSAELPVSGAVVIVRDAATRKRIKWIPAVETDAQGRYKLEKLPVGINYLLEVVFITPDQKPYRLLKLAAAAKSGAEAPVGWSSTAVATGVLARAADASRTGGLYLMEAEKMEKAETTLGRAWKGLSAEARATKLKAAMAAGEAGGSLTIEEELSLAAVAPAKTVVEELAKHDAELASAFDEMQAEMAKAPKAEQQAVVEAAAQMGRTETAPALQGGQLTLTMPASTPTPAPTATPPVPTPTPIPPTIPGGWRYQTRVDSGVMRAAGLVPTAAGVAVADRGNGRVIEFALKAGTQPGAAMAYAASLRGLAAKNGSLYAVDTATNELVELATNKRTAIAGTTQAFSVAGAASELYVAGVTGLFKVGVAQPLVALSNPLKAAVSPSGTWALVTLETNAKQAYLYDMTQPARPQALTLGGDATGLAVADDGSYAVAVNSESKLYAGRWGASEPAKVVAALEAMQDVTHHPSLGWVVLAGGELFVFEAGQ